MDWQFYGKSLLIVALIVFLWYVGLAIAGLIYSRDPKMAGRDDFIKVWTKYFGADSAKKMF